MLTGKWLLAFQSRVLSHIDPEEWGMTFLSNVTKAGDTLSSRHVSSCDVRIVCPRPNYWITWHCVSSPKAGIFINTTARNLQVLQIKGLLGRLGFWFLQYYTRGSWCTEPMFSPKGRNARCYIIKSAVLRLNFGKGKWNSFFKDVLDWWWCCFEATFTTKMETNIKVLNYY
jgi:hypothetical protein